MAETDRPLVLIDVDGVLNPSLTAAERRRRYHRDGWRNYRADVAMGFRLFLNPAHGPMLERLARDTGAELAWGSTWEDDANVHVAPRLGLPPLPVAPVRGFGHKADGIVPWTRGRPFVWLDDEPDAAEVTARIAGEQPHLVVHVDEHEGLTEQHAMIAKEWLLLLGTEATHG